MKITELTVIILTNRNDEKLKRAIESASFAKQIILIDNTNGTNWEEYKKEYTISIISHPAKIEDFSEVRNKALESTHTPWVLFLDSDEMLPSEAKDEIQDIIEKNVYDAVSIQRTDYFLGKVMHYGETGNLWITRLFKTKKGKYIRSVHEVVKCEGKTTTAHFVISHFSHDSIFDFLTKISRYSYIESTHRKHSRVQNTFQMCTFPLTKFILNFVIKLGFLDGYRGLIYAVMMSLHSFFVRVYYYEKL